MNLMFLGAAREVTGSKYLLSACGKHILIDCGMEQGQDTYENQSLPIGAQAVDAVILTHAHIDHAGMLPALYKEGFRGPIFATPATISLSEIMLLDSAHIQEQEAEWRNRKARRGAESGYDPLYTQEDAISTAALMRPASYEQHETLFPGIQLKMTDAGHLLGSGSATITITEDGETRVLVFSGDIGNKEQPILNNPTYPEKADIVITESTYGDRDHGPKPDYIADLADALQKTFDRGGNVVIPSFAVGRTQEILYFLREIKQKGLVKGHDGFPVYMDSPLAIKATNLFTEAGLQFFDEEMRALLQSGVNPLSFDGLKIALTADESRLINENTRPAVIISASGMAEAGRIRHHLKHNLWREECTVLFVGYQSVGTLGRAIVDGADEVKLFGETIAVNAEIRVMKALSGHADRTQLKEWIDHFSPRPDMVFVTHGEESAAESYAALLSKDGYRTNVPYSGDTWDLAALSLVKAGPRTLAEKKTAEAESALHPAKRPESVKKADKLLHKAMERLSRLIEKSAGWSNGIKKQLAEKINQLCDKWE